MIPSQALRSLDAVASHLPFHLNDIVRANEAFQRWCEDKAEPSRRIMDLWTYCYVRRYYLLKFMRDPGYHASDFDTLVESTYQKIERSRDRLECDAPFASWVSVICKNTYLNYVTRRRKHLSIDDPDRTVPLVYHEPYDRGMILLAILGAIERLPPSLQEVATLRFVEGLSYPEIGAATDKELPIIRAYVNKARRRLQADPALRALMEEEEV